MCHRRVTASVIHLHHGNLWLVQNRVRGYILPLNRIHVGKYSDIADLSAIDDVQVKCVNRLTNKQRR